MPDPTSEAFDVQWINGLLPGFRRMGFGQKLNQLQADAATALDTQGATTAVSRFIYTGQPTTGQKVEVGANVFEFVTDEGSVAADDNIGVVIGANARASYANLLLGVHRTYEGNEHPTLFMTDDETPALANGDEDVLLVHVHGVDTDNGTLYLYPATQPGGAKVEGPGPDLELTDNVSNGGPWFPLNLNLSVGAAFGETSREFHGRHAVSAANLAGAQPLLVPLPFVPQSWSAQVRSADGQLKPDAYCAVTVPTAIEGQNLLGIDIKPTTPTVLKRATIDVPLADNDISIATMFLALSHDIRAISYACGEDPGSTLVVSIDKITASTAAVVAALTTSEDLAAGTQAGQVIALALDEAGGDIPIAVTALQALLFTVTAGNGTVAPRSVTFFVDYVELAVATDVIFFDAYGA